MRRPARRAPGLGLVLAAALAAVAGANGLPVRSDGAARLPSGASASEYWDLSIRLDSGHRIFARFLITNEGPGEGSAAAFGHLVMPDGSVRDFDNAKRAGDWQLSADRLRLRIASSILDQTGSPRKFEYDSDRLGVKLHLWYESDGALSRPDHPALRDHATDLLALAAPVRGTLWVTGMAEPLDVTGTLTATHTWTRRSESELAARHIEFFSLDGDASLYVSELLTPGGERVRWLVALRGAERFASDRFELEVEPPPQPSDYPVPAALQLSGPELEGVIRLGPELMQDAPFEMLPQPFRFLLSLKARPRRVWMVSPFEIRLKSGPGRPESILRGSGITSVTFSNPLPPELREKNPGA